jgi:hypothetical protein
MMIDVDKIRRHIALERRFKEFGFGVWCQEKRELSHMIDALEANMTGEEIGIAAGLAMDERLPGEGQA